MSADKRGYRGFIQFPKSDKTKRAEFEKQGRIWNPGMKNHGMSAPSIKAPSHKDGTWAFTKYVTKMSKTKSPKSMHALGGALQKEAARRVKGKISRKVTKKTKGSGAALSWQDTIKYVKGQQPSLSYREVLKRASKLYKKGGASMLP